MGLSLIKPLFLLQYFSFFYSSLHLSYCYYKINRKKVHKSMFDKPNATTTLGLELEGTLLKAVQLTLVKSKPSLDRLFEIQIDKLQVAEHVNPLYLDEDGKLLLSSAQESLVVSALGSHEVLVRQLDVKLKKERDIDAVLEFQSEPLLPYPVENAILDRIPLSQSQEGTKLTLIAARNDHIQHHLAQWNSLQIEPEVVSCVPAALAFFSKQFSGSSEPHFVVHAGLMQTTCVLVKDGKVLAVQATPLGVQQFAEASEKKLSGIDFGSLSKENAPDLFSAVENWRMEITRLLFALGKQIKEQEIESFLLTGEGAMLTRLGYFIGQSMQKRLLNLQPAPEFDLAPELLQRYAVSIGAALSGLPSAQDQINFRQKEFAYPHPWKRLKRPLILYFALCISLAVAILLFGNVYVGYQKSHLRQEYADLLVAMNKPYQAYEKEYTRKHPYTREIEEEVMPIEALTPEEIQERVQYLQKEIKDSPDTFPLLPSVPRVSDLLAWLSTHPKVVGKEDENESPLQIEHFSYTMVKRPELKKKQEKYQVKVEIEFSSPTPKLAREFHDALIAPNDFVDPKGEVKWSANRGKYRTSFFLKDKTVYPSSVN